MTTRNFGLDNIFREEDDLEEAAFDTGSSKDLFVDLNASNEQQSPSIRLLHSGLSERNLSQHFSGNAMLVLGPSQEDEKEAVMLQVVRNRSFSKLEAASVEDLSEDPQLPFSPQALPRPRPRSASTLDMVRRRVFPLFSCAQCL